VAADPALRTGVVSMSHNWGSIADDPIAYAQHGASTNFLIRSDEVYESINAMPRMSAVPVNVRLQRRGSGAGGLKSLNTTH
jgi:hypothetical protein